MAITGVHAMFYSDQPEALRAFLRDKLQIPGFDSGGGWLIFNFTEADMGLHPVDHPGAPPTGTHDISFYCDDIEKDVAQMKARGVEFSDEITDRGYARCIHFVMPGGVKAELYQPNYAIERG